MEEKLIIKCKKEGNDEVCDVFIDFSEFPSEERGTIDKTFIGTFKKSKIIEEK